MTSGGLRPGPDLVALPLLIPVFLGQSTSGEVYLVPWTALFLVLPAALVWNARRQAWREILVPGGIVVYVPLMASVYVFSRSDPMQHMATSYERLLMVAVLSACLYGLRALAEAEVVPEGARDNPRTSNWRGTERAL